MVEFFGRIAQLLHVSPSNLPAEIAARGWVPNRVTEESEGFTRYVDIDFQPSDSLVPRDPLIPTLRDVAHWRTLFVIQSHMKDRRGNPVGALQVNCLYPEEGHVFHKTIELHTKSVNLGHFSLSEGSRRI